MKISVIIPSYKPLQYIWECLDSLCSQTIEKNIYEVLIILNGCNNPWYDKINQYCNEHKNINFRLFQTDEPGVSNARNIGINESRGDYITFIDDDDYVSDSYLKSMLEIAESGYIPLTNIIAFKDSTHQKVDYYMTDYYSRCKNIKKLTLLKVRSYLSMPVCKLIPKQYIGNNCFDKRFKNGEDSLFIFAISNKLKSFHCTNENAIYYRRIRDNSATKSNRNRYSKICNGLNLILAYSKYYILDIKEYSFIFYLSRILATIKMMFR